MRAGALDRKIVIERAREGRDGFNNLVPAANWRLLARVSASKSDVSDRERLVAQEVGADITTRFQIRWSSDVSDVNPKDRIVFDERVYAIVAVKEIGRREGIEITATARAD